MKSKVQTVLIVDDDEEWGHVLCSALSPFYETQSATNGADAVAMARQSVPALIVMDVMMPGGMDGFSALCQLRKDEATRKIPVIMCTEVNAIADTSFTGDDLERYLGTAPSVFLEKPVSPVQILTHVRALIGASDGRNPQHP